MHAHSHHHDHHHHHGHDHHHHHHHALPKHINRVFLLGISLNVLFVFAEAGIGWYYNSLALLSDAGHNLSDVGSLLLVWFSMHLGQRQRNARYTYGYGRAGILAALFNGMMLLVAVGAILWEALHRWWQPSPSIPGPMLIGVAGLGIIINASTALLFMQDKDKDINLRGAYLHMAADALVSLAVVLSGLLLWFTNWVWIDSIIGAGVALMILPSTWRLFKEAMQLSLDAVPPSINLPQIKTELQQLPQVVEVHHLHVWALSTTENALTTHLVVSAAATWPQIASLKAAARHLLEHHSIQHVTIEIETQDELCSAPDCGAEEDH